ncbi:hypothetical protein C8R45DRAFT_1109134 [Mycena sanguinolenta]|nr:hypothetical protein C8R45DRAFT_1109134 [Mycena sanguinolenta]
MDGTERIRAICAAYAHGKYDFTKEMRDYVCCNARTVLSKLDSTTHDGQYNYESLFNSVLELFEEPMDEWARESLACGLFGTITASGEDKSGDD